MRVAVIGSGFGEKVMAPVWRRLGCEVGIASPRDPDAVAAAIAASDLVSIHSPPFLHRRHVLLALEHGRDVLCDKPFGRDAAEARDMRDRAHAAGVLHFLNFEFRRHPGRVRPRELIEAGAIGPLNHLSSTTIGAGFRKRRYGWLFDAEQGGGWLGAYGSHAIDTIRFLFGREIIDCGGVLRTETRRRADREGGEHDVTAEDAFTAWFMLEGGGSASVDTAFSASASFASRTLLLGRDGAIEITNDREILLRRPGQPDERIELAEPEFDPHDPGLIPWLTEVRHAIASRRQIAPSFDDGVATAEVMDRLRAVAVRI